MSSTVNRPVDSLNKIASCDIFINNIKLDSSYSVHKVFTKKEVNKISRAYVEFFGGEPHLNKFAEIDDTIFKIGNEIIIKMGFDNNNFKVFEGIIESNSINLYSGYQTDVSKNILKIECVDKAIKLTNSYTNELYENLKESDIIKQLIKKTGNVSSNISQTKVKFDFFSKYDSNDWEFIVQSAKNNGMVVINSNNNVDILNPSCEKSKLTISNSGKTFSFNAKQRSDNQIQKLIINSLDSFNNKKNSKYANEPSEKVVESSKLDLTELKNSSPSEAQLNFSQDLDINLIKNIADSKLKLLRLKQVYGNSSFLGYPELDINSTVTLEGFGEKFNGDVLVSAVSHLLISGTIKSSINFGFDDHIFSKNNEKLKSLSDEIKGLHLAKITDIEKDPKNQYRVKVVIPELLEIGNNIWDNIYKNGLWAKLSHTYVSKDSGFFFIPEIGSQVIVSFIGNNPTQPIVLGSLYNSENKPYQKFNNENFIKSITMEDKMMIEFNTKDKILKVGSVSGNQVLIDEKNSEIKISDKNENTFHLSKKGINLNSFKDLTIEASGQINLNAKSKINLNANSDISLKGANINNSAKIKFGAVASGQAEISSKGVSTIKGSIVKIN